MGLEILKIGTAIFEGLVKLGIINEDGNILFQYMEFQVPNCSCMMPLNIDCLAVDRIALAHTKVVNGDVMSDPDMEVMIDPITKKAFAYSFQNDFVGYYDTAICDGKLDFEKLFDHSQFMVTWLNNIFEQGYELMESEAYS